MSLSSLSIRRPVLAWMCMAAIFLFGWIALRGMGLSLLPDVDNPYVTVSVDYTGASPELIETDVTEVVEGALSSVEGVKSMSSSSRYGSSQVTLEFDIKRNIDTAVQEVQSAMQQALRRLPDGIEAPIIRKSNPEDQPILWLALSGKAELRDLMIYARNELTDRFSSIEGVSDVQLGGYVDPAIRVWLDLNKLRQLQLTHQDVLTAISNEHKEVPVGRIEKTKNEINLRLLGEVPNVDRLKKLNISRRSGQQITTHVTLEDVGRVEAGLEDVRGFARTDGKLSIGLGIKKQRGVNAVELADRVMARAKTIPLPNGWEITSNFDNTVPIRKSVHELAFTLGLSVLLTAGVCWLFLGSWSSTFNSALAIPTSLFGTFIVINYLGYTLNTFTMLALILGVGIIVDDAIMVLENIFRFRRNHKPREAALLGSEQIQGAAFATSLAIIAIFIPTIYVGGVIGAYLMQFGVTLSVAVAFSTFEALSFTPMRLSGLKETPKLTGIPAMFDRLVERASEKYKNIVVRILRHPWLVVLAVLVIFGGSLFAARGVPKEMVPAEESGRFMLRTELPLGTSLGEADERMKQLEAILLKNADIDKTYAIVGGGGNSVNGGMLFVTLKERNKRPTKTEKDIEAKLRNEFKVLGKDFKVRIQSMGAMGMGQRRGFPVELNLTADEWGKLVEGSKILEEAMEKDAMFTDVDTSYNDGSPELAILPDRSAARLHAISVSDLTEMLQFLFNGINAGKFNDAGRRVDIVVKADPKGAPQSPEALRGLFIRNAYGELVSLSKLIAFSERTAAVSISREDRRRNISVYANLAPGFVQDAGLKRANEIATKVLPKEVHLVARGAGADLNNTFRDLITALVLGILVAYMVLASQYNSFIHPITVLLALPFSVTGALLALKLGGATLNLYSMIGMLLLMGIVKKNSILLVEFANQLREEGMGVRDAIIESCRTRFRPIIMTSFATIAAALPPALHIGLDSVASASMAMGICGGVAFSTLLTFFLVPVAYVALSRFERPHHD